MALEIKAIPTLKGKEAERFVKEADKAYQSKEKTDFSKQVKIARAILRKANMLGSVRKSGCVPFYSPIKNIFLCHETMASVTHRIS